MWALQRCNNRLLLLLLQGVNRLLLLLQGVGAATVQQPAIAAIYCGYCCYCRVWALQRCNNRLLLLLLQGVGAAAVQ